MRKKIGRIFSSRIFFAIFAILASVALWMYVEYTENEPLNHTVNDIPIVFRNEASLRDRGLLISAYDPPVIGLTFSDIPRSIATRLTNQTLSVEVDLFAVTRPGAVHLTYEIIYPTGADGVNPNAFAEPGRSVENISFHIDRLSMRTIPVLGE
ncbi:MAG: hypothetical protein FWB75_03585, partial [Oscillospiraceae bacterium]|nr:hypothetical protein [Oscillospiraceae bacterium]